MQNEIKRSILIDATAWQVWNMLTQAENIRQYMFGAITKSSWQPGSAIEYYFVQGDAEIVAVKGIINRIEAPSFLEYTLFPTNWNIPDISSNYLTVSYQIQPIGNQTELTIVQTGFLQVAEGEIRYNDSIEGWKTILPHMKEVAEKQPASLSRTGN
jgi:uncharacterized protein YndB with AHSA1/START domain